MVFRQRDVKMNDHVGHHIKLSSILILSFFVDSVSVHVSAALSVIVVLRAMQLRVLGAFGDAR